MVQRQLQTDQRAQGVADQRKTHNPRRLQRRVKLLRHGRHAVADGQGAAVFTGAVMVIAHQLIVRFERRPLR